MPEFKGEMIVKTALLIVIAFCLFVAPCATAQSKTTVTEDGPKWTQHRVDGINATRYSLFTEEDESRSRKICHVYVYEDGVTASVTLGIHRSSADRRFVNRRSQHFELARNQQYWNITKDVRTASLSESSPKRKGYRLDWPETSNEDLRWYFDKEFEKAPAEIRGILDSL